MAAIHSNSVDLEHIAHFLNDHLRRCFDAVRPSNRVNVIGVKAVQIKNLVVLEHLANINAVGLEELVIIGAFVDNGPLDVLHLVDHTLARQLPDYGGKIGLLVPNTQIQLDLAPQMVLLVVGVCFDHIVAQQPLHRFIIAIIIITILTLFLVVLILRLVVIV